MSRTRLIPAVAAAVALLILFTTSPCPAGELWTVNGIRLCTSGAAHNPRTVNDGAGGTIVVWMDYRNGQGNIYAQRVSPDGQLLWEPGGSQVRGPCGGAAIEFHAAGDGEGGVLVAWIDTRRGPQDVYVQRLAGDGTPEWVSDGVLACQSGLCYETQVTADNSGGAIVTWRDIRAGYRIYAQRVDSLGGAQWAADGNVIREGPGMAWRPQIVSDGGTGAVIAWQDGRNPQYGVFAQRVDVDGNALWVASGIQVRGPTPPGSAEYPVITAAPGFGGAGAIVAWVDSRDGSSCIYAQGIDDSGAAQWTEDGFALRGPVGGGAGWTGIAPDGSGEGAIVVWLDSRDGRDDVYVQRITEGAVAWQADGLPLRRGPAGSAAWPCIETDGSLGCDAIVTWRDARSAESDLYAQRVKTDGVPVWTEDGRALRSGLANGAWAPSAVTDCAGGAVIAWTDNRSGAFDIYAQRLSPVDAPGVTTEAAVSIGPSGATLNGLMTCTGGEDAGERGFRWRETGAFEWADWTETGSFGTGAYAHVVGGLEENTTYEYQAMSRNSAGWAYGSSEQFTTLVYPDPVITALTPDQGRATDTIRIDGSAFDSGGAVRFDSVASPSATWFPDHLEATVPGGLGAGNVEVTVETIHGKTSAPFDFTIDPYVIDASVPGGHGTVSPAHQENSWGQTARIEMKPDDGYRAASLTDNGIVVIPVPSDAYTIEDVREDHVISVTFSRIPTAPVVDSVHPSGARPGEHLTISGKSFDPQQGKGYVTISGVRAGVASWSDTEIVVTVPGGASSGPVEVFTALGGSNDDRKVAVIHPAWYLAEGTNAWGFATYISIANPNDDDLTARITYMDTNPAPSGRGIVATRVIHLPSLSQTTLSSYADIGEVDFSTKVECLEGKTIAVDRTMTWTGRGASRPESHSSVGVTAPARTWYLPEGSSNHGFETWTLVQNPNGTEAGVTLTYMTEDGGAMPVAKKIPAYSRASYLMSADIGAHDSSIQVTSDVPVTAERSQYRNDRREGSCSVGTTIPSNDFYLAEGTTAWGFTTYVLVQNPGREEARVAITYMTPEGPVDQEPFAVSPGSRRTVKVNDVPGVSHTDLSAHVHSDKPIIAERAMYWTCPEDSAEVCHDSIGLSRPQSSFVFPDGQATEGWETYTLVQNPNPVPVTVRVTYLPQGEGDPITFTDDLPASSRRTYNMAGAGDASPGFRGRASILVRSQDGARPVLAERAMYRYGRGSGTATIGADADGSDAG